MTTDKVFRADLKKVAAAEAELAAEMPMLIKKDIAELVSGFNKRQYSSKALVSAIKQLRADSKVGFRSQDPDTLAMAKAKGKIANAMEGLIERNITTTQPKLLNEFKAARQRIAKTYTAEKALKGENIDAVALGRELEKGKPLSGAFKDVAEFGVNFKGAAQVSPPQQTNFRGMDIITGLVGATATQNPAWLLAMAARPATRSMILSKAYQNKLAKVYPTEIAAIKTLPAEAQVTAITKLLENIRSQGAETQPSLPAESAQ